MHRPSGWRPSLAGLLLPVRRFAKAPKREDYLSRLEGLERAADSAAASAREEAAAAHFDAPAQRDALSRDGGEHDVDRVAATAAPAAGNVGPPAKAELFVHNLPRGSTVESVRSFFEGVCVVRGVRIPKDAVTGQPRSIAFITVEPNECDAARIAMDGSMMGDKRIGVKFTADKGPNSSSLRPGSKNAAMALNKEIISCDTAADVLSLFESKGGVFNHVNFATALHRLGARCRTFDKASRPILHKLVESAASSIRNESNQWQPRGLASACWGIAKFSDVEAPALFEAVAAEAPKMIETFKSQELANIVWAYATAGFEAPALFEAVAAEAPKKIATFTPQALGNTAWAYAKLGIEAPALFEAIAAEAPKNIATFSPQDLANTVWAYATAGVEAPALFDAVAASAPKNISAFKPQEMANTLWAYSKAGVEAPLLFEAFGAESSKKMDTFKSQELANTLWAFATAGFEAPALFEAVASAPQKIAELHAKEMANTVWALTKGGVEAPELYEAFAAELTKKVVMLAPHELANTARAYAAAEVEAPALFEAVAAESTKRIGIFSPQDLANTVWAFATAEVAAPALFKAVAEQATKKKAKFSPQALQAAEWAFETAGVEAPGLFDGTAPSPSIDADESADGGDASATTGEAASR